MKPLKVAIIISSLRCGGAERVAATLANVWARVGCSVKIITLTPPEEKPFFALENSIALEQLDLTKDSHSIGRALAATLARVTSLRRALREFEPDVIVASGERINVYTILACLGMRVKLIVREHAVPYEYNPGRIFKLLRRLLYRFADSLVVLTEDAKRYFLSYMRVAPVVIPNPLPCNFLSALPVRAVNDTVKRIVAVGRLSHEKGFDLLLEAFAIALHSRPDLSLTIWGDGDQRAALEAQCRTLGIERSVALPGFSNSVRDLYAEADLLVLPSRHEALGNVLIEAMAAGVPTISFDCPSGPREVITPELDGVLVPAQDCRAMAQAILRVSADLALRQRFVRAGRTRAERYSLETIAHEWQLLFEDLLPGKAALEPQLLRRAVGE
jgi:GalNAc-alpha-(1->4)-GalNAc-alpha-(1->3)-diNAcBac-PP-undecaprenol alpha-1,4-N-acetyl-D-galactosaminyltransferase